MQSVSGHFVEAGRHVAAFRRPSGCILVVAAAILGVTAFAAHPRGGFRWPAPAFASEWNLSVGSGAEYEAKPASGSEYLIDLETVGRGKADGHAGFWLRISSWLPHSRQRFVNDAFFYRRGRDIVFLRGATQIPGRPRMELPELWMFPWTRGEAAMISGYIAPYASGYYSALLSNYWWWGQSYDSGFFSFLIQQPSKIPDARLVSTAEVTTPAGTFSCGRWRFGGSPPVEVWIAKGAGPFGIVKAQVSGRSGEGVPERVILERVQVGTTARFEAVPLRPDPVKLWNWIWQERRTLLQLRLPQVGLPAPFAVY